jgi:hypothetical protein
LGVALAEDPSLRSVSPGQGEEAEPHLFRAAQMLAEFEAAQTREPVNLRTGELRLIRGRFGQQFEFQLARSDNWA